MTWQGAAWLAAVEVALIVALMAGDFYGVVPFSSTPFLLALAWLSLRLRGLRWRDVGFTRPGSWPRALAFGTAAGVALELFATFVTVPLLSRLAGQPPDLSDFRPLVGNLKLVLLLLVPAWLLAGFGEELGFRGYVMNRIADLGRRGRGAWAVSLLLSSALFGWGHGGQGITGMLQEGPLRLPPGAAVSGERPQPGGPHRGARHVEHGRVHLDLLQSVSGRLTESTRRLIQPVGSFSSIWIRSAGARAAVSI